MRFAIFLIVVVLLIVWWLTDSQSAQQTCDRHIPTTFASGASTDD